MKKYLLICGLVMLNMAVGCQKEPEKHYALQAEVISTNPGQKTIVVKHGEIQGLMPAMTMTYMVAEPKEIETLQPGDKITADLVVSANKGRLEKVTLVSKMDGKSGADPQH